jgi:hypothetical protein
MRWCGGSTGWFVRLKKREAVLRNLKCGRCRSLRRVIDVYYVSFTKLVFFCLDFFWSSFALDSVNQARMNLARVDEGASEFRKL